MHGSLRGDGLFAPASKWRKAIVPLLRRRATVPEVYADTPLRRWIAWGELILRVFKRDPQTCPGCQGRMRQVALVAALCSRGWTTSGRSTGGSCCSARALGVILRVAWSR